MAQSSIEVRRYESVAHFAEDAAIMAGAGWSPVSQMEATGNLSPGLVGFAILFAIVGLVIWWPGFIVAILFLLGALVGRRKVLVVTYRPEVLLRGTQ